MELLERGDELETLAAALDEAGAGRGRVALVGGEAGIGKTCFVDRFIQLRGSQAGGRSVRVLKGNCDSLFTPTPLGPLYDIARQTGGRLQAHLDGDAPRGAIFSSLFELLQDPARTTLLVIEDLHWADAATLDLLKFLGRRLAGTRTLLVATYREDEVGGQHPVRLLFGELASAVPLVRVSLSRLTAEAVGRLVAARPADARPIDAAALHRQTGGNPFFVTEVLSSAQGGMPATVRDAVLARASRLGPEGRRTLDVAAVIGSRIEVGLLEKALGGTAEGLGDCIAAGMLELPAESGGDVVQFRHELAREAVLTELDPARRREFSRLVLVTMRNAGPRRADLAQMAQYAEGTGSAECVMIHGLAAARAAAAVGAHREAAAQYARVLRHADRRPPAKRAALLEAYAEESAIIDALDQATQACAQAIELRRAEGNRLKEGETLSAMAWYLVRNGRNAEAEDASRRAIEALEAMQETPQLAAAYRIQAHLRMLDRDREPAVRWGRRAIDLAERFEDTRTIAAAEMVVGAALLVSGDDDGLPHLCRCLELAREAGLDALVALTYSNIGSSYGEQYRFAEAERHLLEGIGFSADRDLDHAHHYMNAWLALTRLYQGRWSEAGDLAAAMLAKPGIAPITRIMALVALGRMRTRRGDPGVWPLLDEALELASPTGTLQRLAPVRAARAEAAFLQGDRARAAAEAEAAYDLAVKHRHRWHAGELSCWRRLGGDMIAVPRFAADPYRLQLGGDWREAADAWGTLGCPYEQARALADGDAEAQIQALDLFTRLGAGPAAAALRQRMRDGGLRRIPRGPRATTRQNKFGLTRREMEILAAMGEGLSNAQIGLRLHVSPKTVDHHVSAILAKLEAPTRVEATRIARAEDLLPQNRELVAAK